MNSRHMNDKLWIAANQNIKEKKYWEKKFAGDLPDSTFPGNRGAVDYGSKGQQIREWQDSAFSISGGLYEKLIKLSNDVDFKLYIILAAGLVAILYRYTNNNDIIVGTTINKQEEEIDFINTVLALRNQIEEETTFKDLLLQVRRTVLEAIEHQNYPIEVLVENLNMKFSKHEFSLFNILIILENMQDMKYIRNISYNILFCFRKVNEGLSGQVKYNSAIYRKEKIKRIIEQYMLLLEEMLSNPDAKISEIEIITGEEKNRILIDFNSTSIPLSEGKTVHELFSEGVKKFPDNIAVLFKETQLSYRELDRQAEQLSRNLQSFMEAGSIVGIMLNPSLEMIIAIWGILKAGGTFLPIDANFPKSRIKFMLADSKAEVLLTSTGLIDIVDYPIKKIDLEDKNNYSCNLDNSKQNPQVAPDNPVYIMYTSGTTGKPKGVVVEHRNVVAYITSFYREFEITSRKIVLQKSSYSFDIFIEELFPLLLKGGKIAIPDLREREDFFLLSDFINKMDVDNLTCTPLLISEMNNLNRNPDIHTYISGGDILKPEYFSNLIKSGNVYNTYGPTETTVCATYYRCLAGDIECSDIPIGKPVGNYNVYILDKSSRLMPIGSPGELCISGPGVTRGYLNNPELTVEKFVNNPYKPPPCSRLYRTGDLAMWRPDGNIDFLGRVDEQVNIRGYRVELKEIEHSLLEHESIEEVVILEKQKNQNTFLCAYYVSPRGIEKLELQEFASRKLPDYMVPTFFVPIEKFPLTPGGKLDKKTLREMDLPRYEEYVPPENEIEEVLVEIWADVLDLGKDSISMTANFFELGGHSLKSTIVIARIHKALDVKVPLIEMFRFQTIRELSRYIEALEKEAFISINPVEKKEYYQLSSAQKRLYSVQQLDADSTVYHLHFGYYLGEGIITDRVREPFLNLIERHEVLRSSFETINNEAVQRIHSKVDFDLEIYKIASQEPGSETSIEGVRRFRRSFDLSKAPLFRAGLIETPDKRYMLLVELHHVIIDDACTDILTRELISFYLGEELPYLKIQYKDYAEWQCGEKSSNEMKKQEEFWLKCYEDRVPLLEMETDFERPQIQNFEGGRIYLDIPEDVTIALKKKILEHGAMINIFLAVFNILLAKLTDLEDIIVGIPVSGRTHVDLQGIVGMFLNMLALRNRPAGNKTYMEFLKEVEGNSLQALENQDYPFDELVEKLDFKRKPGRSPLIDVILVVLEGEESLGMMKERVTAASAGSGVFNGSPEVGEISDEEFGILAKYDLDISIFDLGNRINVSLTYTTSLFKRSTAVKILELYLDILGQVVEDENILLKNIKVPTGLLTARPKISKNIDFNF